MSGSIFGIPVGAGINRYLFLVSPLSSQAGFEGINQFNNIYEIAEYEAFYMNRTKAIPNVEEVLRNVSITMEPYVSSPNFNLEAYAIGLNVKDRWLTVLLTHGVLGRFGIEVLRSVNYKDRRFLWLIGSDN